MLLPDKAGIGLAPALHPPTRKRERNAISSCHLATQGNKSFSSLSSFILKKEKKTLLPPVLDVLKVKFQCL